MSGWCILPYREEWRGVLALSLLIMGVFPFALIADVMLRLATTAAGRSSTQDERFLPSGIG